MALVGSPIGKPWGQRLPVSVGVSGVIYATWNPADKGTLITLSNGNLTAINTNASSRSAVRGTLSKTSGLWKFEITVNAGTVISVGTASANIDLNITASYLGQPPLEESLGYDANGRVTTGGSGGVTEPGYVSGDTVSIELNAATREVYFQKAGSPRSSVYVMAGTGAIFPVIQLRSSAQVTTNFGASAWAITPSSGYVGWS